MPRSFSRAARRAAWPRLYCGRARGQTVTFEKTGSFRIREQGRDFPVDQSDEFFGRFLQHGGIGGAANETGEQRMAFRSAAGEERRIPDGAEIVESGRARNEKAEARESVADILLAIAQRNHSDGGILDGASSDSNCGSRRDEKLPAASVRIGQDDAFGFDALLRLAACAASRGNAGNRLPGWVREHRWR